MMAADRVRKDDGLWHGIDPVNFTDRRARYTRASGRVMQNVRAWRGRVARIDTQTRKWEYDTCFHAHIKKGAARRCGEMAARRLNTDARKVAAERNT